MTVQLLQTYGNQPAGTLYTTDSVTEADMITKKVATANLTGAVAWQPHGSNNDLSGVSQLTAAQAAALAQSGAASTAAAGRVQLMFQLLTVVSGNSIAAQNRYFDATSSWGINAPLHIANQLSGAPMRFQRLALSGGTQGNWNASGTGICDQFGVYGYSGATLASINTDMEANWFAPIITKGNVPDLVVGWGLLENDISSGRTVAQMKADLTVWLALVRRWFGVRILLNTPLPSFSNNTGALVAAYQAMRDYILSLDDGINVFVVRGDVYENPASPGTPLPGYTDSSVHPNTKGAFALARATRTALNRIAAGWRMPFRMAVQNPALTGVTVDSGNNWTGTFPTGAFSPSAIGTGAGYVTGVSLAENPGWKMTVTQAVGQSIEAGSGSFPTHTYAGGANTQVSTFAELEIISGAELIRWIALRPRISDGSGNNIQDYQIAQTSDGDGDYQNGDVLSILVPPQVAASGNISAVTPYVSMSSKSGGSGTACILAGTYSIRFRRAGVVVVVA